MSMEQTASTAVDAIVHLIDQAEESVSHALHLIDENEMKWTERVIQTFARHEISYRHFTPTTGYGYDDVGRDTLEKVFAALFRAESALVRPHIASGTHALALGLTGLTLPGERVLSATGHPYDTMEDVIGIGKDGPLPGSLRSMGIEYDEVALDPDGRMDLNAIQQAMTPNTTLVIAQRSRGYAWRRSLHPSEFEALASWLHAHYPHATLMVDNCYGEFVCDDEPTAFGADVCVGSLIKNPGGGLAPTGGYLIGRKAAIERIAYRLTAPGIGQEVGSYAASYQPFYQGLFHAPHTVSQALKTAVLTARVFEMLGMETTPSSQDTRTDIIQAIKMEDPQRLIALCQAVQAVSPIDSMAVPEPWDMPGYQHQVIMAAGTFVSGASIELSADAPMRPPYIAYMQGGLTYAHGKYALKTVLHRLAAQKLLQLPS